MLYCNLIQILCSKYEIYEELADGGDGTGECTAAGGWSGSGSNSNNTDSVEKIVILLETAPQIKLD